MYVILGVYGGRLLALPTTGLFKVINIAILLLCCDESLQGTRFNKENYQVSFSIQKVQKNALGPIYIKRFILYLRLKMSLHLQICIIQIKRCSHPQVAGSNTHRAPHQFTHQYLAKKSLRQLCYNQISFRVLVPSRRHLQRFYANIF